MTIYLARRIASFVPVWFGITLFAFLLGSLAPGDPVVSIYHQIYDQPPPNQQAVDELRRELGFDAPITVRYMRWVRQILVGDMGTSYRTGGQVLHELWAGFQITLALALAAFVGSILLAFPIGILSALQHDSALDVLMRAVSIVIASMPSYWLAYLFILAFAVWLRWLPVVGFGTWQHLVLPAATLSLSSSVGLSRLIRSAMLETLNQEYIRTAIAKGVPRKGVVFHHALRNALIPIVTMMGRSLAGLLTGAVVVETVFSRPGVGRVIIEAITFRDYPVIQGFVLFSGTLYLLINLLVDISYAVINPRIRLRSSS